MHRVVNGDMLAGGQRIEFREPFDSSIDSPDAGGLEHARVQSLVHGRGGSLVRSLVGRLVRGRRRVAPGLGYVIAHTATVSVPIGPRSTTAWSPRLHGALR